jgi:putative transposase
MAGARPTPRPCGCGSNANPRSVSPRRASPCLTQRHTAFRFQLSLRDIEELLFERGVIVTYETIRCWCDKFGKGLAHRVKTARRKSGSTWHLDEMFVTLRGEPYLHWRAVDEHGAELDILVQKRRDKAAAKRFVKRVLRSNPVPRKIVTDQLRSYPAAKSRDPGTCKREARVRKSGSATKQPRREQPSTDTRTRASHARLSRPETHKEISLVLRADPATFRAQATSAARFTLSQTTCCPVRRLARIRRTCPKSVVRFLIGRPIGCHPAHSR